MIKRVIFDIDNTLIPWESEYDKEIEKALDELNIQYTEQEYKEIRKAFSEYEKVNYRFDKKIMLDYINNYMKKQYPIEFIDKVLKKWGDCVPEKIEDGVKDTLMYLKNKYEMVILTDWFAKEQINRLEILGINKYFSQVYSAEKTNRKPFKEAFVNAIADKKPEECIMIGDSLERDINGAINAGLRAVYYNPNEIPNYEGKNGYRIINKLEQLKDIL
ncbi:MAG: HAD family hydrolase [Clostridia bacterium]